MSHATADNPHGCTHRLDWWKCDTCMPEQPPPAKPAGRTYAGEHQAWPKSTAPGSKYHIAGIGHIWNSDDDR